MVDGGPPAAAAAGVGGQGLLQLGGQAQVVHHQPAGLVAEHPVDPGDGLHQPVAPHRLVGVHGVQAGGVEPGEPHVAHQHHPQRVGAVAEPAGQPLPPGLAADVGLPFGRVGGRAGHHHLHRALGVVAVVPAGPQPRDLAVELDADAPAHAHHHGLAVEGLEAALEVLDDVGGHQPEPPLGADHGLELGPAGLEPLGPLGLLALGDLLELVVDGGPGRLVDPQLGQAALVVDGHGGPVGHGGLDVVDADVVAEHGPGVGVLQLDGGAGEADEGGVGQGVSHVAGEAVDEVVLASVGLVGDHHDVAALRQGGEGAAGPVGEELLDGGEHHPARLHRQLGPQVGPAGGLHGGLAQQVPAAGEGAEELLVEVVAVGEHHHGGVGHGRRPDDGPGVEGHGEALARPLGVPHHPDAPVAPPPAGPVAAAAPGDGRGRGGRGRGGLAGRVAAGRGPQGLVHRGPHRVELVVSGHLLGRRPGAVVLEHDEVPHQGEEALGLAHPFEQHLEFEHGLVGGRGVAGQGPPGLEPLPPAGEGADPGLRPVGDDEELVHGEQGGQLGLVGLELLPGGADGGVLVGGALELDDPQRQPVDEQHDVGPPPVAVLDDGELVDGQPVVAGRLVEVEHPGLPAPDAPAADAVLHRHPVDQHPVKRPVAGFERRPLRPDQPAVSVIKRFGRKVRVEPAQRASQPPLQDDLGVVAPLRPRRFRPDLRAVRRTPAQLAQPLQRSFFHSGFAEGGHAPIVQRARPNCAGSLNPLARRWST